MEAIYFGNIKVWGLGTGNGPWIMADMENGLFSGSNVHLNSGDPTVNFRFTTAVIKGQPGNWAIGAATPVRRPVDLLERSAPLGLQPDAQGGRDHPRHRRRQKKGAAGTFYEGVMTSGFPSDATENAVQSNIVAAGYSPSSGGGGATGTIVSGVNGAKCVDNNNASGANGNKVQMWDCNGNAAAQNWTVNTNGTLTIDGGCMDITGANFSNGTLVELWTCNGGSNQQWQAVNGQLVNPASGKCLDDPASITTNGTQLQIWSCSGAANQRWRVP